MPAGAGEAAVALRVRAVAKIYPPANAALRGVDLDLAAGRIHGLLGANGAGKSTLIKLLAGIEQPTSGQIWVNGIGETRFARPSDAERAGIGVVHQELPLLPNLTAAENMVLGQQSGGFLSARRRRATIRDYERRAAMFPGAPPADARLERIGLQGWQLTAIIRARYLGSRIVILDEPTSSLNAGERRQLHQNLRRMAQDGTAILYVSHFLDDILDVCDTVTVLRDGRVALDCAAAGLVARDLLIAMTGDAAIAETVLAPKHAALPPTEPGLAVQHLRCSRVGPVAFSVGLGERVGLYGLEDAGSREVLEAVFGLQRHTGDVVWRGRRLHGDARDRIAAGIAFVSGDRARTLIGEWSVAQNHGLTDLAGRALTARLRPAAEIRAADATIRELAVKGTAAQKMKALSGGNQQKVALGRWLDRSGICLLADDPTRGVDVRGRAAIHEALIAFCARGNALLVHSVDPEELVELCDRVLVMSAGRIVAELYGPDLTSHGLEAGTRTRAVPHGATTVLS